MKKLVKYLLAITAMAMLIATPQPASAYWYFKNACAWSITSYCKNKRTEMTKAGRPIPKATTCFGNRSC
jgi:hypothetical protein